MNQLDRVGGTRSRSRCRVGPSQMPAPPRVAVAGSKDAQLLDVHVMVKPTRGIRHTAFVEIIERPPTHAIKRRHCVLHLLEDRSNQISSLVAWSYGLQVFQTPQSKDASVQDVRGCRGLFRKRSPAWSYANDSAVMKRPVERFFSSERDVNPFVPGVA